MTQNDWHMEHEKYNLLNDRETPSPFYGTHDDLVDAISALRGPIYVKLVVHPMHYGFRVSSHSGPWLPKQAADETRLGTRGWAGGGPGAELAGVAITRLNEFATPDRGIDCYRDASFRLVFFGHENLSTHRVSVDSKMPAVTARLLRASLWQPQAGAISVADPALTVAGIEKAFTRLEQTAPADVILIGLSAANPKLDEVIDIARSWIGAGKKVVCFLEQGADPVTEPDERMIKHVEAMLGQSVINPYRAFEEYEGSGRLFWEDRKGWTPQAHYLAAKLLARRLHEPLSDSASASS
jgi:hypothetical protein